MSRRRFAKVFAKESIRIRGVSDMVYKPSSNRVLKKSLPRHGRIDSIELWINREG
jgi:hypothetical protein